MKLASLWRPTGRRRFDQAYGRALDEAAQQWMCRALDAEAERDEYRRERDEFALALADYQAEFEAYTARHADCGTQIRALRAQIANLTAMHVSAPADLQQAEAVTKPIVLSEVWDAAGLTAAGIPQLHLRVAS